MADPSVSTVVLNWNHAADTLACVRSLLALRVVATRVVVCDNASQPSDVAALRQGLHALDPLMRELDPSTAHQPKVQAHEPTQERITLIHTGGNLGYAGGMNVGIRHAVETHDPAWVWVLNNDTEVHPDALAALLERVRDDPHIGICGATLVYHGRRSMVQAFGGAEYQVWRGRSRALGAFSAFANLPADPAAFEARLAYVNGASMLVSRRWIDVVGPMDPSYFLYSEEHDWAHRGLRAGFRLAWAPAAIVHHKHGATIGTASSGGSPLSLFYLYRNKALFCARHHPRWLPVVLAFLAWDGLKLLLKGHPGKAWAVFRGLWAFPVAGRFQPDR